MTLTIFNMRSMGRWRIPVPAAVLAVVILTSCGNSNGGGEAKAGGGKGGVGTALFAADCCTPGEHLACQDGIWCNGEEKCDCWGNCEVGPPPNCDDGDWCTDDSCVDDRIDPPGEGYGAGHCLHVCIPGPSCLCAECTAPGDCDDGNACTVDECVDDLCQYSDLSCDDADICTTDTCDPATGCRHMDIPDCCTTTADCNDGLACTTDVCDTETNECSHTLQSPYCLIGEVCYIDGTLNPSNECESCQYLYQTDRWSGLPATTACDDSLFCTADQFCDGDGRCVGGGSPCLDDGLTCTDTACNEATDTCSYPIRELTCLIGGVCYNRFERNPANACLWCESTLTKTAWSNATASSPCDDGLFCTLTDQCNAAGSCIGSGARCVDTLSCTNDVCNEATDICSYPVQAGKCLVGGVCYNNGDNNPANICQSCQSAVNNTAWTNKIAGTSCDVDGLFCNGINTCNGSGTCVAASGPCTAPAACTTATCDEAADTCGYTVNPGFCYIGGVCYNNGASNPANVCLVCNSSLSQTAWSNALNTTPCNDGLFCTATDRCNGAGSCVGSGVRCSDGLACTSDVCNEATDVCSNPIIAGNCLIGGICYVDGVNNPSNTCQKCQSTTSNTTWTNKAAGTSCDDGLFCNGVTVCNGSGACVPGSGVCTAPATCTTATCDEATDTCGYTVNSGYCYIGGVCYNNGASNPANVCLVCNSATSQTAWSNATNTTPCNDGLFCTATDRCNGAGSCVGSGAQCVDGLACTSDVCNEATDVCSNPIIAGNCLIGGICYIDGANNPSNICQKCQSTTSNTAWTNKGVGTNCDDGLFCNGTSTCNASGTCVAGSPPCVTSIPCATATCNETTDTCGSSINPGWCIIAGTCYTDDTSNPANACQRCWSATSQTAWSNRPSPTACNDGLYCTATDTCNGAGTCTGSGNPCNDGVACTSNNCNEASDSCSYPVMAGFCLIGGICYTNGTSNPANICQVCNSTLSQSAWSNAPSTTACAGDAYSCTQDICNGSGTCTHPVASGWCLIGTACYSNGTNNPVNECQQCASATSQTAWTNKAYGAACTADIYACTSDICNGSGSCIHPAATVPGNDLCPGSALTTSGSGLSRIWTGSGENYCANDNYSSSCGGAGYPDTVHSFDVPVEYDTYRYRIMVGGPANFNPVAYYYTGDFLVPACGQAGGLVGCNNDGAAGCWAYGGALGWDANDSCWLGGEFMFPTGTSYIVVDSVGVGGLYNVKVDRYEAPDISKCSPPQPQIQMGGVWRGTTNDATTAWNTNLPRCMPSASYVGPYYANIYHINHATGPWASLNRGYVVWTDGTLTSGGFDVTKYLLVNECTSPWYICGCDDDTYHYRMGLSGRGSQFFTGKIPSGKWSGIFLTSYSTGVRGNYTMTVKIDSDGDGNADATDANNGPMQGARPQVGGGEGAKPITIQPFMDSGYSYGYPYNLLTARPGNEVYYYYSYPGGNTYKYVDAYPKVRGDVWSGASAYLWDIVIWVYFPVAGNFCCWAGGWSCASVGAGNWRGCDVYADGGRESVAYRSTSAGTYYVAVDSYYSTPRGGWYTIVMGSSPYTK